MPTNPKQPWTVRDVPDQTGRVAIITGSNSGIGFEAARVLASRNATVVLACRNTGKAEAAASRIRSECPGAKVEIQLLDLGSLESVKQAAESLRTRFPRIDLLINNAGVMVPPYGKTVDGFETQFGTNHLGHFALTGLLLERLQATPHSRIVNLASQAHRMGRIRFDDFNFERGYRAWPAYGQSKLANLLFTYELQRRLGKAGAGTIAVAAHPGWSRTELQRHATVKWWNRVLYPIVGSCLSQSAARGALPMLRAATDPKVTGGDYFGPSGFLEFTGDPVRVESNQRSHDAEAQLKLWQASENLTGIVYGL